MQVSLPAKIVVTADFLFSSIFFMLPQTTFKSVYFQEVPDKIMNNISGTIRQVMPIPKAHSEYSPEDHENFPRIFEW